MWPVHLRDWLLCYLRIDEVAATGIGYDYDRRRLVLPVYSATQAVRWNGRGLPDDHPKYISGQVRDYVTHDPCWVVPPTTDYGVVITEDVLSAWVVTLCGGGEWYGWPAMNTNPPAHHLRELVRLPSRFIVWLDNDNPMVRKHARKLTRELEGYGAIVTRVTTETEPKKMGRDDVTRHLNCVYKRSVT